VEVVNSLSLPALRHNRQISLGPAGSSAVHSTRIIIPRARSQKVDPMQPTFSAALDHIKVMEDRIRRQEDAIRFLEAAGRDTIEADRRLRLLRAALDEMRIQLAHLAPTQEQVEAPAWTRTLGLARAPHP
jgi:hypothetical protein